jgi:hypothetical protein
MAGKPVEACLLLQESKVSRMLMEAGVSVSYKIQYPRLGRGIWSFLQTFPSITAEIPYFGATWTSGCSHTLA